MNRSLIASIYAITMAANGFTAAVVIGSDSAGAVEKTALLALIIGTIALGSWVAYDNVLRAEDDAVTAMARALGKPICPDSGLELTRNGEAGPDRMSCDVCDCFGYDPKDIAGRTTA